MPAGQKKNRPNTNVLNDFSHEGALLGRVRHHKYFQHLKYFLLPISISAALQCALYWLFTRDTFQVHLEAVGLLVSSMSLPLLTSAALLTAFRRHESPLFSALLVYSSIYLAMIVIISASRMPLSYSALLYCYPVGGIAISWANYRFHRLYSSNICMLLDGDMANYVDYFQKAKIILDPPERIDEFEINFDTLVVGTPPENSQRHNDFLRNMYMSGVDVIPWPIFSETVFGKTDPDKFEIFHLSYTFSQIIYYRAKRYLDIILVLLTLPLTIPIFIASSVYIYARDPGPVVFVQLRKGYGGSNFRIFKLRTMFTNAHQGAATLGDSRVIPGCNFLRRYRIDEIPQMYNILLGDMSFIGPRPESIHLERVYRRAMPKYSLRLLVRPGLTGWAQVQHGYTGNIDEAKGKLAFDLYYIKHLSLDLDIAIVLKTVKTVLLGFGAR